jgi:hypothetical protein
MEPEIKRMPGIPQKNNMNDDAEMQGKKKRGVGESSQSINQSNIFNEYSSQVAYSRKPDWMIYKDIPFAAAACWSTRGQREMSSTSSSAPLPWLRTYWVLGSVRGS